MRRPAPNEAGYAMAVLLVGMSIAAIMMTMAMPVWKQMAQREKEEELIFRGQQYVHALRMFSMKYANASPPTIDVLVEQRFLRKKYKDPITNDDFQPILVGQPIPGSSATIPGPSGARGASGSAPASPFQTGRGVATPGQAAGATGPGRGPTATTGGGATFGASGGIMGVVSKSKDKSIRLYQGRSHYNEWAFINTPQNLTPGQPGPGGAGVGGRGNQPGGPGGGVGGRGGRGGPGQPPFGPGRGGPGGRGGIGPGGFPVGPGGFPIQPNQPVQPIQPGRGRGA